MTYRLSLLIGLAACLHAAPPTIAQTANRPSPSLTSTTAFSGAAGAGSSASSQSTWKRSERTVGVDIRFKKPEGVVDKSEPIIFTDQAEESLPIPVTNAPASKPARQLFDSNPLTGPIEPLQTSTASQPAILPTTRPLAVTAEASSTDSSTTLAPISIGATAIAPVATPPAARAAGTIMPASAGAAVSGPAATTPPETPLAANLATPATPAAEEKSAEETPTISESPAAPTTKSVTYTDDQIQLVARLLMDQNVLRAADEEPLPSSPDSANNDAVTGTPNDGITPGGPGCYDECCPPPPCLFWVGGVEATFLSPDLNSSGVSFEIEESSKNRHDVFAAEDNDVDDLYMSPRIWLGVQGCCWGANLRYWHLQASEGKYDPSIGSLGGWDEFDCGQPDVGFFNCNRLEAYTIDLEITRRFCIHDCWMQAAIGVRHAEFEHSEGITGLALTDDGLLNGFGYANRQTRGTGFLLGLYGRKPLYPCSCINWFYNARWSAMWGPTQTAAETFASAQAVDEDFVASAASVNGAYTNVDDSLFIGEIQLGLEWDYRLCCLPANAFFRVAVEYQRWDGGNGFSGADSFAGIAVDEISPSTSVVATNAFAEEPQMDLLGFTIGTGLTW